jgi:hypothetical protein
MATYLAVTALNSPLAARAEDFAPPVPALCDVMRHPGRYCARSSWHTCASCLGSKGVRRKRPNASPSRLLPINLELLSHTPRKVSSIA